MSAFRLRPRIMLTPSRSAIAWSSLTAAALVLLPGMGQDHEGLRATGGSFAVGLDSDGDGLHDALEARIGTNPSNPDSDSDGIDDCEELLLKGDPLSPDSLAALTVEPTLHLDVYASANEIVLQVMGYGQHSAQDLDFVWATPATTGGSGIGKFANQIIGSGIRDGSQPGWKVYSINISLPRSTFDSVPSMGIGALATLDGQRVGDDIQLLHLESVLGEYREDLLHNGGGGGVFPVEPGGQIPSGSPDEVCVQTLVPTAVLPGGRVEYQVTDAKCETLIGAVCLPGCAESVLDILIGIDILSLLN